MADNNKVSDITDTLDEGLKNGNGAFAGESDGLFGNKADLNAATAVRGNKLDEPGPLRVWTMMMNNFVNELDIQKDNRDEQMLDCDFYDGIQWDSEDAAELERRGQLPIAYNVIGTTINWVINSEKRLRTQHKVLPRRKEESAQAERKSDLIKYMDDVNNSRFVMSRAFSDAVRAGIGWIEDGYGMDGTGEPLYSRYEKWQNMLMDSKTTDYIGLSDCRYIFRQKWVDVDILKEIFPERAGVIDASSAMGDISGFSMAYGDWAGDSIELMQDAVNAVSTTMERQRVRAIEGWFRLPEDTVIMNGGQFHGEIYDDQSRGHQAQLDSGEAALTNRKIFRMKYCIMVSGGMLILDNSPYRHNRYPFTPIIANIRNRDNLPYGVIRGLRPIQEDINKRASKALAIMSSNQVWMTEDAIDADKFEDFEEQRARPDGVVRVKDLNKVKRESDLQLAQEHINLMQQDIAMIQRVGGVTDENQGYQTNATSGKAIIARQDQGQLTSLHLFDNLRLAKQKSGEKQLSLIEQYMTEEKQFRITGQRNNQNDYVTVNSGLPEDDITSTKADYVISEESWNATRRESQVQALMELMGQLGQVAPEIVTSLLDLLVESMDIDNMDEIVKRIRKITGQRDPDATQLTPEEIQQQQQQQQQQQMQDLLQQLQIQLQRAEISNKEAQSLKTQAEARKTVQDTQTARQTAVQTDIDTQKSAIEAALEVVSAPGVMPVADKLLDDAGYQSQGDREFVNSLKQRNKQMIEQSQAEARAKQQAAAQQQQAQAAAQQQQQADAQQSQAQEGQQ